MSAPECLPLAYFPHVDLLVQALRINRDRLNSRSKIAIDARLLRRIIECAVARLPFSADYYCGQYPDIAAAAAAGLIPDLHRHFVQTGYFEGRLGFPPAVEESYYCATYQDVDQAVRDGGVASAVAHYTGSGAAEGRVPAPALEAEVAGWMGLLRMPVMADL